MPVDIFDAVRDSELQIEHISAVEGDPRFEAVVRLSLESLLLDLFLRCVENRLSKRNCPVTTAPAIP